MQICRGHASPIWKIVTRSALYFYRHYTQVSRKHHLTYQQRSQRNKRQPMASFLDAITSHTLIQVLSGN